MKLSKQESPVPKTPKENHLAIIVFLLIGVLAVLAINWVLNYDADVNQNTNSGLKTELPKFASCSALYDKLKENQDRGYQFGMVEEMGLGLAPTAEKSQEAPAGTGDYSQTNIQVAGVDEADSVKTDGTYIYTISGKNITISQAYPVEKAKLLSKITMADNSYPLEMFIHGNNLLVFGDRYDGWEEGEANGTLEKSIYPSRYGSIIFVEIYNLADPENPVLKRKLEFEGNYDSSRKIDNYVYFVFDSYPDYQILEEKPTNLEDVQITPLFRDFQANELADSNKDFDPLVTCSSVSYIEPIITNQYLTVIGLPIDDYDQEVSKEVILGGSENIYASLKNLYVANTNYQYYETGIWNELFPSGSNEETAIYKFSLTNGQVNYQTKTSVPGTVLNQFSMDEDKDYFRIATTLGQVARANSTSSNNVYILDKDLNRVGTLEDIAPGEEIYSARFMGDKAYLVTFKKVDPFFTLDLSDPKNPKVIGKLKIPGYSDYLHPYDENHIIGVGKETVEAEEEAGNFAWYQGIKMAIFDVTDFANPKEIYKVIIGDRGTDSPILQDHKAFLFSKEKNLLALPILLAEIDPNLKDNPATSRNTYGDYVFQGTYVYQLTLDKGFELKGRVTHIEDEEIFKKSGYYFEETENNVLRNLYIKDNLYSISDNKIKINSLSDLSDQGTISLK